MPLWFSRVLQEALQIGVHTRQQRDFVTTVCLCGRSSLHLLLDQLGCQPGGTIPVAA
jgi:hypothetical protein